MYIKQYAYGFALSLLVSVVITSLNYIIRFFVYLLVDVFYFHTYSVRDSATMLIVFVITFINTGILLLLAEANTNQIKLLSWVPLLNGPFPDLTEDWYISIAPSLVLTMFLNSLTPYIELIAFLLKRVILKGKD